MNQPNVTAKPSGGDGKNYYLFYVDNYDSAYADNNMDSVAEFGKENLPALKGKSIEDIKLKHIYFATDSIGYAGIYNGDTLVLFADIDKLPESQKLDALNFCDFYRRKKMESVKRVCSLMLNGTSVRESIQICESVLVDDKVGALLNFLHLDDTPLNRDRVFVAPWNDNVYCIDDDKYSFLICTDEEADEAFKAGVESLIDELGLEAFSLDFQETILDRFVDEDELLEDYQDSARSYAEDIANETQSSELISVENEEGGEEDVFVTNRLFIECLENNIISEDDFKSEDFDEEGDYIGSTDLVELYCDHFDSPQVQGYDNAAEWYAFNFGKDALRKFLVDHDAFDVEGITEYLKDEEGRGYELNSYDGNEYESSYNGTVYYIYPDCDYELLMD